MWQVTSFDPLNPPATSPAQTFVVSFPVGGRGKLHIKNASPVDLYFFIDNSDQQKIVVQAGEPRNLIVNKPRATIYWTIANKLNTNAKQLQSLVYVEGYLCDEPIPASHPLSRLVNTQNVGFGAFTVQSVTMATFWCVAAIFNPATSGVNATCYSAMYTSSGAFTTPHLRYTSVDPSFTNAVVIANRIQGGPTTQMHATAEADLNAEPATGSLTDSAVCGNNSYDFCAAPDQIFMPPGFGLIMTSQIALTATKTQMSFKWTETPV